MKKIFLLFTAISLMGFCACSDDDDNGGTPANMEGLWANIGEYVNGKPNYSYNQVEDLLEFKSDGTVAYKTLTKDKPVKYEDGYLVNYSSSYYSLMGTFRYTKDGDKISIANLLTGHFLSSEQFYVNGGAVYGKVKGTK